MTGKEEKTEIKEVRHVDTFSPQDHLVQIPSKTNPSEMEYYLMVQWRKKWMLEYNPKWAMVTEHQIHIEVRMITATTSIFDEDGKLRSTGSASIYLEDATGKRVETPLELVETRALGRALGNAGFGTQYALPGTAPEEMNGLAEAPVGLPNLRDRSSKTEETETGAPKHDATEGIETPAPADTEKKTRKAGSKIPENVGTEGDSSREPASTTLKTVAEKGLISTVDEAKAFIIPIGTEKDKYMGEVFATNKNALLFYAETYKGTDVNLRRAARILLKLPLED